MLNSSGGGFDQVSQWLRRADNMDFCCAAPL
jgi:hypothetical protein